MRKSVDLVYVVASKLGSIGMGSTAYYAIKNVDNSKKLSYKIFCRGSRDNLELNKKNIMSYGFLEYLSYPFRFIEKVLGIKFNPFRYINYFFGKIVYWNSPKSKIYHTWMGISPEAILKAKKNGATLILEGANSHPLTSLKILNEEYRRLKMNESLVNIDDYKIQYDLIKKFDYIMCPSDFVYDSFFAQGFNKKQLVKMPYGVDINKFKQILKKSNKKIKFIFIGSVQVRKGIHYLLSAWDELKLKNAELIVVGRVWPDAVKIVDKYKKNKTINFVGFNRNPKEYLEKSDVFISPSLEEGSALTCYEAMACGLPLIATYNTGTIASDKKEGFIIPIRDIKTLKEKIKYFYDNPKEIKKMGKNARKKVEKFSWDKYGKRLAKFYEKVL